VQFTFVKKFLYKKNKNKKFSKNIKIFKLPIIFIFSKVMNMDEYKKQAMELVTAIMNEDFKKHSHFPDYVEKAKKCMKHVKCLGCLDTSRVLMTTDGYFHGVYYDEYTCGVCNGKLSYIQRHNRLEDAILGGRQIPCNCMDKRSSYSHTFNLASIYVRDFEQKDKADERVEEEKKKNTANAKIKDKEKEDAVNAAKAEAVRIAENAAVVEAEANKLKQNLQKKEKELKEEEERIKKDREQLTEDKKPRFECQRFEELNVEKLSIDITIDITGLVEKISSIITLSAGNILALPNFLKSIDGSLNLCWLNSSEKNHCSERFKNDKNQNVYIRFDFTKVTSEKKASFKFLNIGGSKAKEYMYVSYLLLKPINDAAIRVCDDMMSEDFEILHTKLRSMEKDKK